MRTFSLVINGIETNFEIEYNVSLLKKIKSKLNIDLTQLFQDEMKLLGEITTNCYKIVDIAWMSIKPNHGVSEEEFGAAIASEKLETCFFGIVEAVIDFFPDPLRRERTRTMMKTIRENGEMIQAMIAEKLSETILMSATN